jgi:hypothetical protein
VSTRSSTRDSGIEFEVIAEVRTGKPTGSVRREHENWGAKFIERLAADLKKAAILGGIDATISQRMKSSTVMCGVSS